MRLFRPAGYFFLAVLLAGLILLFGCVGELHAQNLGTVNLGTTSATLTSSTACTGSAQNFTTGVTPTFFNLGQTQHIISATAISGVTNGTVVVNGVDNAGVAYQISDTGFLASGFSPILLTAYGYYTNIQVSVSCNVGGSFRVTYVGMFTGAYQNFGIPLQSQTNKPIASALSAGSTFAGQTFNTPYAISDGVLSFDYSAAGGPAGSSLQVACFNQSGAVSPVTFPLSTTNAIQNFPVSHLPCTQMLISYISGGASASTFSMVMLFTPPGTFPGVDPCQAPNVTKTSAVITAPALGTTQIVAIFGTAAIYACGYQGSQSAAGAIQWEYGTGASCATGTTVLTGVITTLSGDPIVYGPGSTIFKTPAGNALCLVTTVAGAFGGVLTYVQQ